MAILIRDGHSYLTRGGQEVGPVRVEGAIAHIGCDFGAEYQANAGTGALLPDRLTDLDLVKDLGVLPLRRPVPPPLQVEEGKRYMNAKGQIVGPARFELGGQIAFMPGVGAGYCVFAETGMVWADEKHRTELDLVTLA